MTLRDRLSIPLANLWRIKLRSALTMSGVMIAIGAFVTLLSFGAGNQKYVTDEYNNFGLLSTVQVFPLRNDKVTDTTSPAILNDSVIDWLSGLPGVELAYPFDNYDVKAIFADTAWNSEVQTLPQEAARTPLYSSMAAGRMLASDSAREAVVTKRFLDDLGLESADSVIGRTLVISIECVRVDSGLAAVAGGSSDIARRIFQRGWLDSLNKPGYAQRVLRDEAGEAATKFVDGFFNATALISDTLEIVGVLRMPESRRRSKPILIPAATARRFAAGGLSNDPAELFAALSSGQNIFSDNVGDSQKYPSVTLQIGRSQSYQQLKDSIEARGFRSFSYAEQFEDISRLFVYFDMGLALIGLIALITASLGIVNTMIMAIMERRREIGVLKSLGASEADIRLLFLFETGLIGVFGSVGGIILGWLVSRLSSAIAQAVMINQGGEAIELFTLPWWLVGVAFLFGLFISIAAGAYPAARAARVDPMEALRVE